MDDPTHLIDAGERKVFEDFARDLSKPDDEETQFGDADVSTWISIAISCLSLYLAWRKDRKPQETSSDTDDESLGFEREKGAEVRQLIEGSSVGEGTRAVRRVIVFVVDVVKLRRAPATVQRIEG